MQLIEEARAYAGAAIDAAAPLLARLAANQPKIRKYLHWATLPLEERYRGVSCAFTDEEKGLLCGTPKLHSRVAGALAADWAATENLPPLERMLELDRRQWLPNDLLVKADKMTMAASLELRVPFLDHQLIEWSATLPAALKLRGSSGKWLLRQAAAKRLPAVCTSGIKKGFTVPVSGWIARPAAPTASRGPAGFVGPLPPALR